MCYSFIIEMFDRIKCYLLKIQVSCLRKKVNLVFDGERP